jgi:hypothetical protein
MVRTSGVVLRAEAMLTQKAVTATRATASREEPTLETTPVSVMLVKARMVRTSGAALRAEVMLTQRVDTAARVTAASRGELTLATMPASARLARAQTAAISAVDRAAEAMLAARGVVRELREATAAAKANRPAARLVAGSGLRKSAESSPRQRHGPINAI